MHREPVGRFNAPLNQFGSSALLQLTALLSLLLLYNGIAFAQSSSYYDSRGIFLDDGAGHSVTLLPPASGLGGGTITLPPAGLNWPASNGAGVLQNDGLGNLTWSPVAGVYMPLSGGTMSGDLGMASHNLTNVGTISAANFTGGTGSFTSLTSSGQVTFSSLGTGVLHTSASGGVSSSLIVDADVSPTASIQYSKIGGTPTSLPPSGSAGGSLNGSYPNPTLAAASVTSAQIVNGTIVDADVNPAAAILWSKVTGAPASLPPSGPAGGVLAGSYPNPDFARGAITATNIINSTIVDADISPSAAISYSKLSLTNSIGIGDLSATGSPSSTTFLRGDNTWATTAINLPFSATMSDPGELVDISELGLGKALVGDARYGVGILGTSSGTGFGVAAVANGGSAGSALRSTEVPGSSALPVLISNQGSNPTDIAGDNWSITHDGLMHGDGSHIVGATGPLAIPLSFTGNQPANYEDLYLTQNGGGDAIRGITTGVGAGVTGWSQSPNTGPAISAWVGSLSSAPAISIGNYGFGIVDISSQNWYIGVDGSCHGSNLSPTSDVSVGGHVLASNATTSMSVTVAGDGVNPPGCSFVSVTGNDVAGTISLQTNNDNYSFVYEVLANVTVTFAHSFPAGSRPIVIVTEGPGDQTHLQEYTPLVTAADENSFTVWVNPTWLAYASTAALPFSINYQVIGVNP